MNQKVIAVIVVVALIVAGFGAYGWWARDLRWRPHVVARHDTAITALLDQAGWVSPGLNGQKRLYLIDYRDDAAGVRYQTDQFRRLQRGGVDTRAILFARRERSTAAERTDVAALWAGRSWATYQAWMAAPVGWTAPGAPSADADPKAAALVENSRQLVDKLTPMLADNGVAIAFPMLFWRDAKGHLRSCACDHRQADRFVRQELGLN